MREHGMLEEGVRLEKEGERERAKKKGKMPAVLVGNYSPTSIDDPGEEIARLKE